MRKVRFGVIGTNTISDKVIAAARLDSRFELTAVCSRTIERAEEFAGRHGIQHVFTSLEEMAESPFVDAVYIATPNCMHADQAVLCMSRGKHVLCEKPMASNAKEVKRMIEASEKFNVTLMEAMISTLNPNFAVVRERLDEIAPVRRYFSSYCQYSSRYDKFKEGVILNAFKKELSNGAVMDIGIYTIYPMVVLFGKPDSIQAQGSLLSTGVDAQGAVNFRYDGMDASVIYSKISDSFLPSEIQGENGTLTMDQMHITNSVTFRPHSEGRKLCGGESIGEVLQMNPYFYEIEEFIDLIVEGKRESLVNSHQNSLSTIEIIDEIRRQLGVEYPADRI